MFKQKEVEKIIKDMALCQDVKELCEKTGYGRKALREALEKNPLFKQRILRNLKSVQASLEGEQEDWEKRLPEGQYNVLDTSVIRAKNLMEALDLALKEGKVFVLTSVTIRELDRKQGLANSENQDKRIAGFNANKLLAKAVKNGEKILSIKIPENAVNPDECILEAFEGKQNAILWTADKAMLLQARAYGIKNSFIDEQILLPSPKNEVNKKAVTSYALEYLDGNIFVKKQTNPKILIQVRKKASGEIKKVHDKLEIGDKIFIVWVRENFTALSIVEQEVVNIAPQNNVVLVFKAFCYDLNNLEKDIPQKYAIKVKQLLRTMM